MEMHVVLVTGASSGIGKAIAQELAAKKYFVFGTSRKASFPTTVSAERVNMLPLDVTEDASIAACMDFVHAHSDGVDVLVNNSGYGLAGAIEETSIAEAKQQLDTNFMGMVRMARAVLPEMRASGRGMIINVGSVAGQISIPYQAFYSASKAAVEAYSEALKMEVEPFGVKVFLLQPGDFHTGFTEARVIATEALGSTVYQPAMSKALSVMERDELEGADPHLIAAVVERTIRRPGRRLRIPVGPFYEKVALTAKRLLPEPWFEFILRKYYRLD